jgi:extracellular elastinolytic metalloproteinase
LFDRRLAWHVSYRAASDAVYDVVVDASTGAILHRSNQVKFAARGDALVWDQFYGAAQGGAAATVNLQTPGWLPDGATTLSGPNVHAFSDVNDDDHAQASEEVPRLGDGTFDYPLVYTPSTGAGRALIPCTWLTGSATTWQANRAQTTVESFYLANRFHDHLAAAPIGFDAASGAFQGGDPLLLNTDDGAATGPDGNHVNNANMSTPWDGESPTMQMYLWRGSGFREVNGGDDAPILYHEYTHGLTNRLVHDSSGAGALNSAQAGAMGEAWSDWYAMDYVVDEFPSQDTAAPGEVDMGAYTDATRNSIRTQPMDCPVGAAAAKCPGAGSAGSGGYTYGDFGRIAGGPEVARGWRDLGRDAVGHPFGGRVGGGGGAGDGRAAAVAAGAVVPG